MSRTVTPTAVLADDHHIIRNSLKLLLEAKSVVRVVGEAANGLEALTLVHQLSPDMLVLDMQMPGLNGLDVLRELSGSRSPTRVIVLSCHADEPYVIEALRLGAAAYVLKQATAASLVEAFREVAAGRRYLSPPLSECAIEAYTRRSGEGETSLSPLTVREAEVLRLIAQGRTSAEIGKSLSISRRTVDHHRTSLMRKLRCRTTAELIRQALLRADEALSSRPLDVRRNRR